MEIFDIVLDSCEYRYICNRKLIDQRWKDRRKRDRAEQVLWEATGEPPKADQEIPARKMGRNRRWCWVWKFVQQSSRWSQEEHKAPTLLRITLEGKFFNLFLCYLPWLICTCQLLNLQLIKLPLISLSVCEVNYKEAIKWPITFRKIWFNCIYSFSNGHSSPWKPKY